MEQKQLKKQDTFKGVDIEYMADAFICLECGLDAGTVKSAGDVQRAIVDKAMAMPRGISIIKGQE